VRGNKLGAALLEVVPQDAGLVLQHAHKGGDLDLVVLDHRSWSRVAGLVELLELDKAGEAPVLLLVVESVIRLGLDEAGRVAGVGDGEGKLGADVPALFGVFVIGVVEVDRDHVVGLPVRVAHGKE
jgi:hypothetical protein